jgi:hypothetical protein
VTTDWHERLIARHAGDAGLRVHRLRGWRAGAPIGAAPNRLRILLANLRTLRRFDVLLTSEVTSALLRRLGLYAGLLAVVPHGAGDRAVSFEPRFRHFDRVLVPGAKTRAELLARGLTTPERCIVTGYARFDLLGAAAPRFFDSGNPVVLYNPHFRESLSSWPAFGMALVAAFARTPGLDLIVAPHIRASGAMRRAVAALARGPLPPNIRVDPGSLHSVNMDYTRAADIYLGDVSSQVYEFLCQPRPCVFLDPRGIDWRGDMHYRHWHYGPVAGSVDAAMAAVAQAVAGRAAHGASAQAQRQRAGFVASIAEAPEGTGTASERIAVEILRAWAAR